MGDIVKKTTNLFTQPSFWAGSARVMDLFGAGTRYNTYPTAQEADARALKRDWEVVGQDIKSAVKEYESTLPSK